MKICKMEAIKTIKALYYSNRSMQLYNPYPRMLPYTVLYENKLSFWTKLKNTFKPLSKIS